MLSQQTLPPSPPYPDRSASPTTPASSAEPSQSHRCLWQECTQSFVDPEALYNHLCNDHIGRKSTNNLCLTCKWKDCGTTCAKRDHITSHLRVHTPLKPHVCEICKKSFKRPQDLKKHEKIHTEEHHAQHKHSKAITVADPAYVNRVRGDNGKQEPPQTHRTSPSASNLRVPVPRSKSHSSSSPSDSSHFGLLPTPSPELAPAHHHHSHSHSHRSDDMYLQNSIPSWEVLRSEPVSAGSKRSHDDYSVDDFFTDMKKRRVNPSYDPRMAERLNNLAYAQSAAHANHFNPRSVSLDIRTPEELAAVNEFLLTLGRDVSSTMRPNHGHSQSHSGSLSSFPADYFDPVHLSEMGLTGMPGMPSAEDFAAYAGTSPSQYSTGAHYQRHSSNYGSSMYPVNDSHPMSHAAEYARRSSVSSKYNQAPMSSQYSQHHYHQPTPPLDSSGSPHSTVSTPINSTPPQIPMAMPMTIGTTPDAAAFDYLRAPRGPGPVVGLVPQDYMGKDMRPIVPLKSIPGPLEPKVQTGAHQGTPAKLSSETSRKISLTPAPSTSENPSPSSSLYPLLTSGDAQYKLAPLNSMYRSSSAQPSASSSRESSPASSSISPEHSSAPSPSSKSTYLPSLRSIASIPAKGESEDLANQVEKVELASGSAAASPTPSPRPAARKFFDVVEKRNIPAEERQKHAEFIKDLLLTINEDFRRRYGTGKKVDAMDVDEKPLKSPLTTSRDVEMSVA
ncbi:hypothetical protein VKT23_005823 [Stygiomarasmius scandens]|uniref:C2H2-type domain-containing protein n=1 Tax=Marasmiellus scandens TaxID=2682957 RepID=A0ABR1JPM1_9AGAR